MVIATATATTATATRTRIDGGYACPHCAGPLRRIPRRWIDRLLGLVTALRLRRYGCRQCPWQGNLNDERTVGARPSAIPSTYRGRGRGYRI
jgi:hypothetical protein